MRLNQFDERTERLLATNHKLELSLNKVAGHFHKDVSATIISSVSQAVRLDYFENENHQYFHTYDRRHWSLCMIFAMITILSFVNLRTGRLKTALTVSVAAQTIPLRVTAFDIVSLLYLF